MHDNSVIHVEHLSKAYLLGQHEKQDTLAGAVWFMLKSPIHNLRQLRRLNTFHLADEGETNKDILWALRDISFDVKRGEVLGIIGRNGAGKSTLLKVLSRIAEPTRGRAEIRGRVSALLEVGTGFHPELTGRENIYLNGTILGMKKREIDAKFDEIVDFSGVERFLDTPVKRYSSGMKVRLAFSVAAHLEPEILIIDEVLAVGDFEFQNKCLGKMQEVTTGTGRTVLFVSHNMTAVSNLCTRCILLKDGAIATTGVPGHCIEQYERAFSSNAWVASDNGFIDFTDRQNFYQPESVLIRGACLSNSANDPTSVLGMGEPFTLSIETASLKAYKNPQIGFILRAHGTDRLCTFNTGMQRIETDDAVDSDFGDEGSIYSIACDGFPLLPGEYWIDLSIAQKGIGRIDFIERAVTFTVVERDIYGTGYALSNADGVFYLKGCLNKYPVKEYQAIRAAQSIVKGTDRG